LETASQLAQAGVGLPFQATLLATILLKSPTHLLKEIRGESEDPSFALGAEGEGGRGVRVAMSTMAGAFAAAAAQGDEGTAQQEVAGGGFG
jgi:hypothetical protein